MQRNPQKWWKVFATATQLLFHRLRFRCVAAQVLSLELPTSDYIVVTRNTNHLPRFGLPVEQWENITP